MKRFVSLLTLIALVVSASPALAGQWHGPGGGRYWHGPPPAYYPAPRVYYGPPAYHYPPSYIVVDPIAVGLAVGSMITSILTEPRRYSSGDPIDAGYNAGYNDGVQIGRQQRYEYGYQQGRAAGVQAGYGRLP